jgi:hypothetical protein
MTGGGLYLSVLGRRLAAAGDYRAKIRVLPGGDVTAGLVRANTSNVETVIQAAVTVPGLKLVAGEKLQIRMQVLGTSPTTLQVKLWKSGTTEPAAWLRSVTDSTAGFQTAGSTGLGTYLSSSVTNSPVTVRIDDWLAAVPQ